MARATSAAAPPIVSSVRLEERARNITGRRSEDIIVSMSSESLAVDGKEGKAICERALKDDR
jgi:hypothetical protein